MRLDSWMPTESALVSERYSRTIDAPSADVHRAMWEADFGGPVATSMLALRALPSLLLNPRAARERLDKYWRDGVPITLRGILSSGFVILEESPNDELVIGLTGRFWTPTGGLAITNPAHFRDRPAAGQAQAAWNFLLTPTANGGTVLSTETRVRVADDARTSFRAYWTLVRPFSGLLRRLMLRAIARELAAPTRGAA
jgi:hypothetical protein